MEMEGETERDSVEARCLKEMWMGMESLSEEQRDEINIVMGLESLSEEQRDEINIVAGDIMSLCSQRRRLLASLSPEASVWKRRLGGGQGRILVKRFAAKDYTAAVQGQEMEMASSSTEKQRVSYFNILFEKVFQDMEDLLHQMMSMAYLVVKPGGATVSSYMADEWVNSTSRLMHACNELYADTDDNVQAEEEQRSTILHLNDAFLRRPLDYVNELALLVTEQEVKAYEQVVEDNKKRAEELRQQSLKQWEQRQKQRHRYDKDKQKEKEKGKGKVEEYELRRAKEKEEKKKKQKEQEKENENKMVTMEYLNRGVQASKELFALHRNGWKTVWGSKSVRCGGFWDTTTLSPMHFTLYTPNTIRSSCGVTGRTLQIYSIQIQLEKGLNWPLKLYGVVAARDTVDRNRNIVFSRSRIYSQELNEDGSLCLTGPSRAIVAVDPVDFEIELKIKEGEESQDQELITLSKRYDGTSTSVWFENSLCVAELKLKRLDDAVQATVMGICLVEGDWPFEHGCRVACSLSADADEIVLLDCRSGDEEVHVESDGYLQLSRNVVSVQSQGTLVVVIRAYLESGRPAQDWKVEFPAQLCQTSELECSVGNRKVKVVVAWSLLVKEKQDLLMEFPAVEP